MAENGNSKKWLTTVYTILGVIISSGIIFGCLWTAFAKPQVSVQSRLEITNWWGESGALKVEKIADDVCEKKVAKMEEKMDRIYQMNLRRLNRTERREFEMPEDTIN